MSCSVIINDFPRGGCILYEGYSAKIGKKKEYLHGEVSPFMDGEIKATLRLFSQNDVAAFADWWINGLKFGHNPFEIQIPFFGTVNMYLVRMTNDLVENKKSNTESEISLVLELVK